jgi:cytosine/adenosine deaminase-related metal-dependent hydrolase
MAGTFVLDGCAVATLDAAGTEHASGHIVVSGGTIAAVGRGPAPAELVGSLPDVSRVDASGCLATPGLVNTHHHLYQWATRGFATGSDLFGWLRALYPLWAGLDAEIVGAAARAGLAWLARNGCSTTTDHHYVFPGGGNDLLAATIEAAATVGLRFHPGRGSMDLGESAGGLPPDSLVEDTDSALAASAEAVARYHDASPGAMVRIAVAPCSPFSCSTRLVTDAADLARRVGVRLHTHLAEVVDEERYCLERYGKQPVDYLEDLGWLGDDVWLAHCVHLSEAAIARFAAAGVGVAHCPGSNGRLGVGIAPVRALLDAGVPVGLGVDGAASNEHGGLADEPRQAMYLARLRGGPTALSAREALRMATVDGARCLGREAEIGSLEPGKRADVALWRVDGPLHGDIDDPVVALVLGPRPPLELLLVEGRPVVRGDDLRTVSEQACGADLRAAHRRLGALSAKATASEHRSGARSRASQGAES